MVGKVVLAPRLFLRWGVLAQVVDAEHGRRGHLLRPLLAGLSGVAVVLAYELPSQALPNVHLVGPLRKVAPPSLVLAVVPILLVLPRSRPLSALRILL